MENLSKSSKFLNKRISHVALKNEMNNYFEMGKYIGLIYIQLYEPNPKFTNDATRNRLLL